MINISQPQSNITSKIQHHHSEESLLTVSIVFLSLCIIIQNILALCTIKIRSSQVSILYSSLCISDLILATKSLISLLCPASILESLTCLTIMSSLSVLSLIAVDKAVSLACPFSYSNIVTYSTVYKVLFSVWGVSIILSLSFCCLIVQKQSGDGLENLQQMSFLAFLSFIIFLLCISLSSHLYVNIVAHRHTKTIYKTQRSHHASLQRINSISAINKESITPNQGISRSQSYHTTLPSSSLATPMQMTKRSCSARNVLSLFLPPLSLFLSYAAFIIGTILELKDQYCITNMFSNIIIQIPLLIHASANPWVHGLLPKKC